MPVRASSCFPLLAQRPFVDAVLCKIAARVVCTPREIFQNLFISFKRPPSPPQMNYRIIRDNWQSFYLSLPRARDWSSYLALNVTEINYTRLGSHLSARSCLDRRSLLISARPNRPVRSVGDPPMFAGALSPLLPGLSPYKAPKPQASGEYRIGQHGSYTRGYWYIK